MILNENCHTFERSLLQKEMSVKKKVSKGFEILLFFKNIFRVRGIMYGHNILDSRSFFHVFTFT